MLTGEHGVGVEKRDLMGEMFNETDLACQQRVKCAFDPDLLLNPGKVFPRLHRCAELGRVHVHRGAGRLPRAAAVLMLDRTPATETPTTAAEVLELVADAGAAGRRLEIVGGGTKRGDRRGRGGRGGAEPRPASTR